MVKEQRYIFDVQDIKSLIYACPHCGQEVVCELKGDYQPGSHCVSCSQSLQGNSNGIDPNFTLLTNLRLARHQGGEHGGASEELHDAVDALRRGVGERAVMLLRMH